MNTHEIGYEGLRPDTVMSPSTSLAMLEIQHGMSESIADMLNGRARKSEINDFLEKKTYFQEALEQASQEEYEWIKHADETELELMNQNDEATSQISIKAQIIALHESSIVDIRGHAHKDHHGSSWFERRRHSLELTDRRRALGTLATGAMVTGSSYAALAVAEQVPEASDGKISIIVGTAGALAKVATSDRARSLLRPVFTASSTKAKDRASDGFSKHDSKIMNGIHERSKTIPDKDDRIDFVYSEVARLIYGPELRAVLATELMDYELNTPEEVATFMKDASRLTTEWLYGEYSLDVSEGQPINLTLMQKAVNRIKSNRLEDS